MDSGDEWASIAQDLSISRDDLVQVASSFATPHTTSIDEEPRPTAPILAPRTTNANSLAPHQSANSILRQLANKTSSKSVSPLAPSWYPSSIKNKGTASNDVDADGTSDENDSSAYNVDKTSSNTSVKPQKEIQQQNTRVKEVQQFVEYSEFVKLNEYKTIQDVIMIAYQHENLSPKHMAAVWTSLSRSILATTYTDTKMKYREQPGQYHELQSNLKVLLTRTLDGLDNFGPIHLSQLSLSIAKIIKTVIVNGGMNIWSHKLFREVFCPGHFNEVFQSIAFAAVPLLPQFDAQAYANVAYACAISGCLPRVNGRSLYDHISNAIAVIEDMSSFTPQNLTNLMWAFASAKIYSKRLFGKLASEALRRDFTNFESQHLSNIAWSCANASGMDQCWSHLFEKLSKSITTSDLSTFSPQSLANIVWSFSTAKHGGSLLFDKVASEIERRTNQFKPQEISNICWAYASNGSTHDSLFLCLTAEVATRDLRSFLSTFSPHHLSNIAWSYAVVNVPAPRLFNGTFTAVLLNKRDSFSKEDCAKLYQWHLWQKYEKSQVLARHCLPQDFARQCYSAFRSQTQNERWHGIQQHVVSTLHALGLSPKAEYFTQHGYRLDALVEIKGNSGKESVGVIVDLRQNMMATDSLSMSKGRQPNGKTLLKRRQISSVEWIRVVNIPYWEWDKLGNRDQQALAKKQAYIRSLLGISNY